MPLTRFGRGLASRRVLRSKQTGQIYVFGGLGLVRRLLSQDVGRDVKWRAFDDHLALRLALRHQRRQLHGYCEKKEVGQKRAANDDEPATAGPFVAAIE